MAYQRWYIYLVWPYNWINEKMQELELYVDGERKIAKWSDIKALFDVSTCLKVFCQHTLSALKVHPDLQNVDTTVLFLSKCYSIISVKMLMLQYYFCQNVHATVLFLSKCSCYSIISVKMLML